ncbi:hypothetical protein GDO81_012470 [Engystomops pustulosus]|uniref:Uncharacterized protein n=1 Tax=Engystomops pustulosus TaxID=76066 RepID=A0AAV7BLW8_ENGPU|nr:hypothetical protein GDO81_012470 [Engystomops pustulosus]
MIHGLVFLPVFLTFFSNCVTHDDVSKIKADIDEQSLGNDMKEIDLDGYDNIVTNFPVKSTNVDPDCP